MASLRNCSREMLDVARSGVGWIALWKVGRSWEVSDFYPLPDFKAGVLEMDEDDISEIRQIIAVDPNAILVNSYYHNLGDAEVMDSASLAEFLRWQYENCHPLAAGWDLKKEA